MRSHRRSRALEQTNSLNNGTAHIKYSSSWSGAVWSKPTGTFTAVTGTITIPTLNYPEGSSSAWVGIDGHTCKNGILQTGIDMTYKKGATSYDAWYEWFPHYSYNFRGITIAAGDVLKFTVTATSTTSGIAEIQNLSNGQTVTRRLSSSHALCLQDAEWIVEDYDDDDKLVRLCDFGTVDFTDAYATTSSRAWITPNGATEFNIEHSGKILTFVSERSDGVTISYRRHLDG